MSFSAANLVSHNAAQVQQLCDRALWLRRGQIVACGEPEVVVGEYTSQMRSETQMRRVARPPQLTRSGIELRANENRFGSLEVEITDVRLFPTSEIGSGDSLSLEIDYFSEQSIPSPIFQVSLGCEEGKIYLDLNTEKMGLSLPTVKGKGKTKLEISRLDLAGGQYFLNVGVYEKSWAYAYDYHWQVYPLLIRGELDGSGLLNPPCRWQLETLPIASS